MSDTDMELLARYIQRQAEDAFAEIVRRHLDLVHSAALRQVRSPQLAEEVAQSTFLKLARHALELPPNAILTAWLYQVTRHGAIDVVRREARRQLREQIALEMNAMNATATDWAHIEPLLDEAMQALDDTDRAAVLLRYFENKSLREVGEALGASENAIQKRLTRAVERLREFFARHGVTAGAGGLVLIISANSVQAAPVALAPSVTAIALAKGASAGGSTLTLIKGALKIMAWTKTKMAIIAGVAVLLAAGTITITVKEIQDHWTYPWQDMVDGGGKALKALDATPPQVRIVRSKFAADQPHPRLDDDIGPPDRWRFIGVHRPPEQIAREAFFDYPAHINNNLSFLVILPSDLPGGSYDYIANLPSGSREALQTLVKRKFGLVGKYEMKDMDVLLLQMDHPDAPGLRPGTPPAPGQLTRVSNGLIHYKNRPITALAEILERRLEIPVVDQSGLTGNYDLDFPDNLGIAPGERLEKARQVLLDEFGLKLVTNRQPHEVFVIEKAK